LEPVESNQLKSCCAALYQSDVARFLLGDSFHPGGIQLTERLGALLQLGPQHRVLDVACGKGESAIFLAQRFGCEVTGLDFGTENVTEATRRAAAAGLGNRISFQQGDAEKMPYPDASFDAVICECAFCTFPEKSRAAAEFARILKLAGRLGLSDLTRSGPLPPELEGLLAWIACIADARPINEYVDYLKTAGLKNTQIEYHDEALAQMVRDIQGRLFAAEIMVNLKKLAFPGLDLAQAKGLARAASDAVRTRLLGYSLITAWRDGLC
jgi:arsenite methyltransferase